MIFLAKLSFLNTKYSPFKYLTCLFIPFLFSKLFEKKVEKGFVFRFTFWWLKYVDRTWWMLYLKNNSLYVVGAHSLINEAKNISSDASDTLLAANFLSLQWLAILWIIASFHSRVCPLIAASNNLNNRQYNVTHVQIDRGDLIM